MIQEQKKEAGIRKQEAGISIFLSLVFLCFLISSFSFLPASYAFAQIDSQSNTNRFNNVSPPTSPPTPPPAAAPNVQTGGTNNNPPQTGQTTNKPTFFTIQNPLRVNSIGELIQSLVVIFTYLVVLFGVLALVYVGLQYILARGNPERMKELSRWLLWIVIGIAIVIGARIIVSVVINTLGASGVVDQKVIQSADNALQGR